MSTETLSKETLAGGLAHAMCSLPIEVLAQIVARGKKEFITHCRTSDQFKLSYEHYESVFSKIARKVKREMKNAS